MKFTLIAASALLVGSAAGVLAFKVYHRDNLPQGRDPAIVALVTNILEKYQYQPKPIGSHYSIEVYDKYLNSLDDEKKFFLQPDINYLSRFRTSLDSEINGDQPLSFFHDADSIFNIREKQASLIYTSILSRPFHFNGNGSINTDMHLQPFPADLAARQEVWHKLLKYKTMDVLVGLEDKQRLIEKDSAGYHPRPEAALEAKARGQVKKVFDLYFEHLNRIDEKKRFSFFMDAVTHTMDPHTDYFAPADNRYFNEMMSGVFYGIGALLQATPDGNIKIASIVTGGPAWKEGQLKAGDIILKVGQNMKEPVDISGFSTNDAVKIIRGDKGTIVKLTVRQTNGTIITIPIVRDKVNIEETFAKSFIIQKKNHRIGYIVLPEFYADFNHANGRHASADMRREINKLNADSVDGIILDLRFNGGGSLEDAVNIAGQFEPQGPVVQVRSGDGNVQVDDNQNGPPIFTGPLVVLVNEGSASASEILTAALQDYHRAVIIGSPSTYGKGTVQRMINLDRFLQGNNSAYGGPIGDLKLTIQKFYRINGGSTQLKGVTPDIILPDTYFGVGERTDKDALPWDHIPPTQYSLWDHPLHLAYLRSRSASRVSASQAFQLVNAEISLMKKMDSVKSIPLNITAYRREKQANDSALKKMDALVNEVKPLKVANLPQDLTGIDSDSTKITLNQMELHNYRRDIYLQEAVNVMDDMISPGSLQNNGRLTKTGN